MSDKSGGGAAAAYRKTGLDFVPVDAPTATPAGGALRPEAEGLLSVNPWDFVLVVPFPAAVPSSESALSNPAQEGLSKIENR